MKTHTPIDGWPSDPRLRRGGQIRWSLIGLAVLLLGLFVAAMGGRSAGRVRAASVRVPLATATSITVPALTFNWATPGAISYGTPLSSLQLNATATAGGIPIPGFITYSPPMGAILPAGADQQLLATFTPVLSEFHGATTGVMITVNPAPTTLSLRTSPATPVNGQPVSLTAVISTTVTGVDLPTGTVTFSQGGATLGPPVPLAAGAATLALDSFSSGAGNLNAVYTPALNGLGSANFIPSQAELGVTMGQNASMTDLRATNSTTNVGQSVIFTARVTGAGTSGIAPTGAVSFLDVGGPTPTLLALAPLDTFGEASLTESQFPPGGHRVLAAYAGDRHYEGSQSAVLIQLVRSCAVVANLSQSGPLSLDLVTGAGHPGGSHFLLTDGNARVVVSNPIVTYCANPGRANERAVVAGTVAVGVGRFRKGDQITVMLRTAGPGHAPVAIVEDAVIGRRIVLLGPFNSGAALKITTI